MTVPPEIEASNKGQRSAGGSEVAVRLGTADTILLPQISRPDGSRPDRRALRGHLGASFRIVFPDLSALPRHEWYYLAQKASGRYSRPAYP
jgi:hypothetical protein